jgi:hypothetical protein
VSCTRCNGRNGPTHWWIPLLQESLCHTCYGHLIEGLPKADLDDLKREAKDTIELEEKRQTLWQRRRERGVRFQQQPAPPPDDSAIRFSLLELDKEDA